MGHYIDRGQIERGQRHGREWKAYRTEQTEKERKETGKRHGARIERSKAAIARIVQKRTGQERDRTERQTEH